MITSDPEFYVTGGTVRVGAASYVERQADTELFEGLLRGDYCYVLDARQRGKSSLVAHTAERLGQHGIAVVFLDLSAVGIAETPEQWCRGLLEEVGQSLGLRAELRQFWSSQAHLHPIPRWMAAIRQVVLPRYPGRLILFLDELDFVFQLGFSADPFFAMIRAAHNKGNQDPEWARLAFCLIGSTTPADLIQDVRITPFNVGRRIALTDFTEGEAATLATGLGREEGQAKRLLRRVLYWTGGHPYLTQKLCMEVAADRTVADEAGVDHLCEVLFLQRKAWREEVNLADISRRLLESEGDPASLLDLYARIHRGQRVLADETAPRVRTLALAGIVRIADGHLEIRNRIYKRVFDQQWVTEQMPDAELQRQQAAYRRGLGGLLSVGNRLAENQDCDQILHDITQVLTQTMGYEACCFRQIERDGALCLRSCAGLPPLRPDLLSLRPGNAGLLARVASSGEPAGVFNLADAIDYEFPDLADSGLVRSLLAVPIELKGQVVGVLECYTRTPHKFAEDEVRVISTFASQAALAVWNAQTIEKLQRLNTALMEVGRDIQTSLLPPDNQFDLGPFRLRVRSEPALEVGGDLYNVFPINGRKWAVVLGDVSGKGIQGATYMTVATTLLEARAEHGATPAAALAHANRWLYPKIHRARMFVSLLYGALDTQDRTLTFSNAGQSPPIYCPRGGEPQFLRLPGLPLGALQDARYQQRILRLQPGDALVLYSDGFIEARDGEGEPLGYEGLLRLVADTPPQDDDEWLDHLFNATLSHIKGDRDDLTALVIHALH